MSRSSGISGTAARAYRPLLSVVLALAFSSWHVKAQNCALVTNSGSNDITLIDTVGNTTVPSIPVGLSLKGIAITPDRSTAYVANDPCGVSVIDLASRSLIANIVVGCETGGGIAVRPDGARVYVPISFGVAVIETSSNTVLTTVPISSINPPNVAITPTGELAYVTGADGSNNVTVIETATNTVVSTFLTGVGPTTPYGIAFTPDGTRAYVTNNASEAMSVAVIDTVDNSLVTTIPLNGRPTGTAVAPDGARAYVLNGSSPSDVGTDFEVTVIETATNTVITTISVGGLAFQVGITPDAAHAYVPNFALDRIAAIAAATNNVVAVIPGGAEPFGIAIRPGACPARTAVIGGCDSRVTNVVLPDGDTISDRVLACGVGAKNHGAFVSCVSHVTNALKKAGIITGAQKGALQSCASKADIP